MSDRQWTQIVNASKVALAFINAFAGILAAYPGPELSPLLRLMAAATVAGCGAALLYLQPPGRKPGGAEGVTVSAVADELERRSRRRQQAVPQ